MRKKTRLHKYIANSSYCSRRHAELLIEAGLVVVNGNVVRELGTSVTPGRDTVTIHGEVIVPPEPLTIMLNKPAGFISSTHDTHDRLTVMDLIPRAVRRRGVVPAGRLDLDTTGLMILTNDGDLLHRITHPRYGCPKEYFARVTGRVGRDALRRLENGVLLADGPAQPVRVFDFRPGKDLSEVRLELTEGRKREVKRLFSTVGHEVVELQRTRVGRLQLGGLPLGAWRELNAEEIEALSQVSAD